MRYSGFKIKGGIKSNLTRLAVKICEKDPHDEHDSKFKITDMIRATVYVNDIGHLKDCYERIATMNALEVIRVQNHLNTPVQCVTINFIYKYPGIGDSIVGEVLLRKKSRAPNYFSAYFLHKLLKAENA